MQKEILVIFSDYPLGTNAVAEKLRMTVGLVLNDDNAIKLLFLGNSRFALQELDEAVANMEVITKHIKALASFSAPIFVEEGGGFEISPTLDCHSVQPSTVTNLIDNADAVIH